MIKNITNLGDAAIYCDFGDEVNRDTNSKVINFFKNIKKNKIDGIINLAPSYNKLIISYDLSVVNFETIRDKIENLEIEDLLNNKVNKLEIPVCFEEEFNLDINRLEKKTNKSFKQFLKEFLAKEYFCYMTGFIAGMPFLGDLNKDLRINRLETPRVKVPKGAIGVTEQFTNIYTFESPGGWNIVGNTPIEVFDKKNKDNPTLINPGDKIKFYEITKKEFESFK
tara:strand:- start:313 stop:984 length:672 start_codon:yes stop_codon:yes gene_type:complete